MELKRKDKRIEINLLPILEKESENPGRCRLPLLPLNKLVLSFFSKFFLSDL
jgi:hypothetical protein